MSSTKKVLLKSSDGETFEVDETVVLVSETIKNMIDDGCVDDVLPLPNVSSNILPKVIEYCKKHVKKNINEEEAEELKMWEAEYMDIGYRVLFDLTLAAKYLHIKGLLDLTVEKAASRIRGMTPEEIRKIRKENTWAFE